MKHLQIQIDIITTDEEFNSDEVQAFIQDIQSGETTQQAKDSWKDTILGHGAMNISVTYGVKEVEGCG